MGDNVLLVEDDPAEAEALIRALADPRAGSYTVEWVKLLAEGLQRARKPLGFLGKYSRPAITHPSLSRAT